MKNCKMCGEPIGSDKRKDSVFCSSTCKGKYHEQKKETEELKSNLGQIAPEAKPQFKNKENTLDFKNLENLEPFKNILNGFNNDKKVEETMPANTALPPMHIKKTISVQNPAYQKVKQDLAEYSAYVLKHQQEIKRLNSLIKDEQNKNGVSTYIAGGTGGALLGGWLMSDDEPESLSKNKRRKVKNDTGKTTIGIIAGALLGLACANAYNSSTEEKRKKEKAENIKKMQNQLSVYQNNLNNLLKREWELQLDLLKYPSTITIEKKVLNPAYLEALIQTPVAKPQQSEQHENISETEKPKINPLETDRILSAQNMATKQVPLLDLKGKWLDFFGKPQPNFFLVVHGMSGEGKTHFTIQLAKYLAENHGRVLYVSGEEGFAPTMQQKIKDMGAMVPNLYVGDFRTGEEILNEVQNKYHFIIIDSTNNMDINPELMKAIRQRFKQSGFIAVSQSTKDDKIRGSYQIVHDSDITVKVKDGIAVTTKNRFKAKGTEFDVFAAYRKPDPKIVRLKSDDRLDEGFKNTI